MDFALTAHLKSSAKLSLEILDLFLELIKLTIKSAKKVDSHM